MGNAEAGEGGKDRPRALPRCRILQGMTLIACLSPDRHPVLLADTLLSSTESKSGLVLPSVGLEHEKIVTDSGRHAVGMEEKVVVLSDHLMLAWAGEYLVAQKLIRGLSRYFGMAETTRWYVEAFLRAEHAADLDRVSLIVCVREGGRIHTWTHRCVEVNIPTVGKVCFAGTGGDRLVQHLGQVTEPLVEGANPLMAGVATALFLGGFLLADELYTGAPLAAGFGGAYEVGTFVLGKATRLNDFAFVLWFGEKDEEGLRFNIPAKVMRRYERDGQACYHCVEFESRKHSAAIVKEEVFIWRPFLAEKTVPHGPADIPSLNTPWQVNVFCFKRAKMGCDLVVAVRHRKEAARHVVKFQRESSTAMAIGFDLAAIQKLLSGNRSGT